MAVTEEAKLQTMEGLMGAAQAFLQTDKGVELLQKVDKAKGKVSEAKEIRTIIEDSDGLKLTPYKVKGSIYDRSKGADGALPNTEIQLLTAIYPIKQIEKTRKVKVDDPSGEKNKLTGKVKKIKIEETYKVWIKDKENEDRKKIKTDQEGRYEFTFGVPTFNFRGEDVVLLPPTALVTKESFAPEFIPLISGIGQVNRTQPPIAMVNLPEAAKEGSTKLINEANKLANTALKKFLSPAELLITALRSRVLSFAKIVQNKLFPLAIQLMIIFGITKLAKRDIDNATCPSDALLKECIRKRNSIVRQLNQIYIIITANTILAAAFLIITKNFKMLEIQIQNLAFPVAVPPGIGVPQSLLSILDSIKTLFKELAEVNKDLRRNLLMSLIFLVISLVIILKYLKKLDALIEKCSGTTTDMTEINAELLALQEAETIQGNEELKIVNGFQMSVEPVKGSEVDGLYRRQAIAKNSAGVILLRGEPSFSAIDQVLIDELAFYIEQNNLKAD